MAKYYMNVHYYGLICLVLAGCGMDCVNEEISRDPIPGMKVDVVLFSRDAGATTGFTRQISILPSGQMLPDDSGNVFICDRVDDIEIALFDKKIVVSDSKSARIFKNVEEYSGVKIEYKGK